MEKSKTGLIIAVVVVVLGVVLYRNFRNPSEAPEMDLEANAAGQPPAAAAAQAPPPPAAQAAQSREVGKGEVLAFSPGQAGGTATKPTAGSWFSLELVTGFSTYIGLQPGPDGGIVIGKAQPASGSHAGAPDGKEKVSVDAPWAFFGATGMHFTAANGIKFIGSGQLDFSAWRWTWNDVKEVNLGAGKTASFNWSGEPGKPFTLEYQTVIPSDMAGFGGKKYTLHLEGVVKRVGL